jgi:hypothetical protein
MKSAWKFITTHLEWILAAAILLPHLYAALSPVNSLLNWYSSDDAFYYFKVAQNIAGGLGSTFDGINLTNGYHPLWMLICIPVFSLAKFDLILPLRVLVMISAGLTAGSSVLFYRLGRRVFSTGPAVIMALIWALAAPIHDVVTMGGMETGVSAFFILLLLERMAALEAFRTVRDLKFKDYLLAGLVAALMVLSRLDNIFVAMMCAVWLVFRSLRTRYLVLADILFSAVSVLLSFFLVLGTVTGFEVYSTGAIFMIGAVLAGRLAANGLLGLYEPAKPVHWKRFLAECGAAAVLPELLAAAVLLAGSAFGLVQGFPKAALAVDAIFGLIWLILTRRLAAGTQTHPLSLRERFSMGEILPALKAAAGYALVPAVTLLVYTGWNKLVFGTPTPVSGQIKHWWASLVNPVYGLANLKSAADLFNLDPESGSWTLAASFLRFPAEMESRLFGAAPAWTFGLEVLFTLALIALIYLLARKQIHSFIPQAVQKLGLAPLLAGVFYHSTYYPVSGYLHARSWYWVGEMIFTVLITGGVLQMLWLALSPNRLTRIIRAAAYAAMAVVLFVSFGRDLAAYFPYRTDEKVTYIFVEQARELENMTEPGARIGTTGGGGLAYFIQGRTIVNLDGLMNSSAYFKSMQNGTAAAYLDRMGLQYVFDKKYVVMETDPYQSIFKDRLERIDRIGDITLYHYIKPQSGN